MRYIITSPKYKLRCKLYNFVQLSCCSRPVWPLSINFVPDTKNNLINLIVKYVVWLFYNQEFDDIEWSMVPSNHTTEYCIVTCPQVQCVCLLVTVSHIELGRISSFISCSNTVLHGAIKFLVSDTSIRVKGSGYYAQSKV